MRYVLLFLLALAACLGLSEGDASTSTTNSAKSTITTTIRTLSSTTTKTSKASTGSTAATKTTAAKTETLTLQTSTTSSKTVPTATSPPKSPSTTSPVKQDGEPLQNADFAACPSANTSSGYEICMMKALDVFLDNFLTVDLPKLEETAGKTLDPQIQATVQTTLDMVQLNFDTCHAYSMEPGAFPEAFSNCMTRSLEQALQQTNPNRDPVTASALSKIIDFWYAVRGCSNMGPGSFDSCSSDIVASVDKALTDLVVQTLTPDAETSGSASGGSGDIATSEAFAQFPAVLMKTLIDAGCFGVDPVLYFACTNEQAINAWDKLILEDLPATVFTKDSYYRYSSLDRRIRGVLETCATEAVYENYTACYEREMVAVREFAQQSVLQMELLAMYENAWAKEIFACAEARARMQEVCTQTVIESLEEEFTMDILTDLSESAQQKPPSSTATATKAAASTSIGAESGSQVTITKTVGGSTSTIVYIPTHLFVQE